MTIRNPDFGVYPQAQTRVPLLEGHLDGFESEEHSLETDLTTYPVEDGKLLTDNLVRQQRKIILRAVVTSFRGDGEGPSDRRPGDAWLAIDQIYRKREPLSVITPLRAYNSVVLTKASAPVNVETGRGSLYVTLEFSQVLSARVERILTDEERQAQRDQLLADFMAEENQRRTIATPMRHFTREELIAKPLADQVVKGEAITEDPDDRWAGVKSAVSRAWTTSGINARSLARPGGLRAATNAVEIQTVSRVGSSLRQTVTTVVGGETVSVGLAWLPTARKWHASVFDGAGAPTAAGLALTKHGQPLADVPTGGPGQPPGEIVVVGTVEPTTRDAFSGGDSEIAFVLRRSAPGGVLGA